ncbi:TIGR03617 family F420-dependent LLM class oxidoreductase [Parahaliea sp. F7430]|uniref:TIGR03617 family F420-dependent LLM class oxidoreductase n=1 Tax=Sediminihaliea albiluteola TaxID=2758564 RepID=A0A7W2TW52_9GAMM|nr:TIGR03617 family F420-dependent LLM class oxidoreductase [Sediminihaliea albiluteola]MBA6413052.1 TIGR03617 family F420-dependent LLM class oxidoreductase [Sediminihaliea albiluteola]
MFKVYATTPETMGPEAIGEHAKRAEAMGFDGLQVPDAVHDGLVLATLALQATERLIVGTSVLVAFPRSPMTVAVAAWDLQRLSKGRFELGLGTQIRQNIEQRYSAKWLAPVAQMREYLEALKAIFHSFESGERLDYRGEHYSFTRLQPFFNPGPLEYPAPPLYCGAVGPLMTRMVGSTASGMITHPTNTPPRYIREVCLPRLQAGFDQAGRKTEDFQLILGSLLATGRDDATVAREWEKQRQRLAFLYSTPAYWPSLELFGWQDRGEHLLSLTREGRWQDLAAVVDDKMLEAFVPRGRYEQIAKLLQTRYAGLASALTFPIPDDPADDEAAAKAIAELKGSASSL